MSGEIKVTQNVTVEKGGLKWSKNYGQRSIDMDGDGQRGGHVQEIGTSAEIIDVGEVWDQGWLLMENLDPTNYVDWGPYDGGSAGTLVIMGRMYYGDPPVSLRLSPSVTFGAIAHTAACKLDVNVFVA
jgi:hypothetical protein